MDTLLQFVFTLCSILLALLLSYLYQKCMSSKSKATRGRGKAPKIGGAWPIIGHMHLLRSGKFTHRTLGAMADKHGPIFALKFGLQEILVVNRWEEAKECFTTHDRVFSNRPTIKASKLLAYDFAMFGFAPYGSYWRELRKIAMIELLSNRRLDMLKSIRAKEVKTSIKELYELWKISGDNGERDQGVLVDLKQWFGDLTHNVAIQMVGGKRYFGRNCDYDEVEARKCKRVMRRFFNLMGVFVMSDVLPFLGWLDLNGLEKKMKMTAKELDTIITGWLEEHKQRKMVGGSGEANDEQDFMDVMLNILQDANISDFDADTINKATCLNMILAGSDTTMVSLTWAISLLLNNPHVLKKALEELEIHIGKDRQVEESDVRNLIYLQAIVKETFRLYPPVPLIGLHCARENCTLAGYDVSAKTHLMVNVWKIHRDERTWPDPLEFKPERFLTSHSDVDVRGQHFELIPFGSGRRMCPGITFAHQVVHLTLANLLHCFEIKRMKDDPIDMTESLGATNLKKTSVEVMVAPRLSSQLYVFDS